MTNKKRTIQKFLKKATCNDEAAGLCLTDALVNFMDYAGREPDVEADGWEAFLGVFLEEMRAAKANQEAGEQS